jgi:polysaccharide export outer membrane protein
MSDITEKKRVEVILDQAELGQTVQRIVDTRKDDQRKQDQLAIGGGDVISVIVRDHPELTGKTLVTYGGEALLPLVNDPVMVKGLTTEEATEKVTEIMKKYVKDPFVTVVIDEYRSKMFYVIDDIGCTPYPITRPNMTVRDALFLADWGTNRALGRIILMKPHKTHPIVKKIDAFDIIYRGNLAGNLRIDDGDVIYTPMTIAGKTTQTVNDTIAPFQAVQTARNLWLQSKWSQKGLKSMFRIYPSSQDLPQNVGQQ